MHDGSLFLASNLYSACLCDFENAAINQCFLAFYILVCRSLFGS